LRLIVTLSNNRPITILTNASNVFPENKYNCLKEKNPDKPIPPRVICSIPIKINIEDIQARRKLLYDNLAFIGVGHGWSGLTLLIKERESLKVCRS
jgi:hypothetical protein